VDCVIGVDLGGTNVRAAAFYEDGAPAGEHFQNPSHAQEGTPLIIDSVAKTINQAIQAAKTPPKAVGLAIPGHIDDTAGLVRWAPNFGETINGVFQNWLNIPVRDLLQKQVSLEIHMDNDANMAAFGEYRFGSGKNSAKCLVMLTVGTGIGGGVILSPDSVLGGSAKAPMVLVGGNKGGAELGHVVVTYQGVDCRSGEYGSIEGYCGRDAIVQRAIHRISRGRTTIIKDLANGDLSKITPKTVSDAALKGDEVANEIWDEVGTMLGVGIGNYINVFAPDIVAIGGNIARAGDLLLKPAIRTARNIAIKTLFDDARVLVAEQIEDAGMLGGAALALESLKWNKA
jgi:glucokinase